MGGNHGHAVDAHGHGHGHGPPKVPDWQQYKVQDVPELLRVQKLLQSQGLKDPWLRNEVWRFQQFGTVQSRAKNFFFRGFKWGLAALLVTIAVEKGFETLSPAQHDHKEGGHGHH